MQQIVQDLRNGNTTLENVPAPQVQDGHILVRTTHSLVSLGTERMLVAFGKANWLQKALQQPERVKTVLQKIKTDGIKPTLNAVNNKLNQPLPLGYSSAGVIIATGRNVTGFRIGDRVATNGHHAEIVSVPQLLAAKIPAGVTDEEAAFTVVGAIGLQGIRLIEPSFGETITVIGLGLIGQITAQLLVANGCRVVGVDPDPAKRELAKSKNIICTEPQHAVDFVQQLTGGIGADGVIITASAKADEIIAQAAQMSRKRGRIVLTGVVGLNINRADFYEKELSFRVSCSYGPGRYDAAYEQKGQDYPIGYVRWTEQRNFEAVLHAIDRKQLDVSSLITKRVPLNEYHKIYSNLTDSNTVAAMLVYPEQSNAAATVHFEQHKINNAGPVLAGVIGAGNFTGAFVLPAMQQAGIPIKTIASKGGLTAATLAKKYGIPSATTDYTEILRNESINTVIITTRHHQHAAMTSEALAAGKHVFVEKPLAITREQLQQVMQQYQSSGKTVTVGFNRRFAPLTQKIKELLGANPNPLNITITVNAGAIPPGNWINDPETGGGRIIGEACHFIDLCSYIVGSPVVAVCTNTMNGSDENATILLRLANGSNATVHYFANGSKTYDKERIEIYSDGRTLILENWKKLTGYGFKGFNTVSSAQDKGHVHLMKKFVAMLGNGGDPIIPFEELVNTTSATFAAMESIRMSVWVTV
ncbi:bi-domain-containing oxidoreductase [Chitinophagaceae bacterium MMS25-I14]